MVLVIRGSFYIWQKTAKTALVQGPQQKYASPENPVNEFDQSPFSDKEILEAVYSDYRFPEGFFTEDLTYPRGGDLFHKISYLDEFINNERVFFCTDDVTIARQHVEEEITKFNRAKGYTARTIIKENQNEKMFEFIALSEVHDTVSFPYNDYYYNYRVQKCGYLSYLKSGYLYASPIIGAFAPRPVTRENVKELLEYLWYSVYGGYDNVKSKVLRSTSEDIVDSVKHTIFETEVNQDNATGEWCDLISINKLTYIVNKNSGVIELYKKTIEPIKGKCSLAL